MPFHVFDGSIDKLEKWLNDLETETRVVPRIVHVFYYRNNSQENFARVIVYRQLNF